MTMLLCIFVCGFWWLGEQDKLDNTQQWLAMLLSVTLLGSCFSLINERSTTSFLTNQSYSMLNRGQDGRENPLVHEDDHSDIH